MSSTSGAVLGKRPGSGSRLCWPTAISGRRALKTSLAANRRLNAAHLLKESFEQLWDYGREGWALCWRPYNRAFVPKCAFGHDSSSSSALASVRSSVSKPSVNQA